MLTLSFGGNGLAHASTVWLLQCTLMSCPHWCRAGIAKVARTGRHLDAEATRAATAGMLQGATCYRAHNLDGAGCPTHGGGQGKHAHVHAQARQGGGMNAAATQRSG
jgi:hypothetical protein